MREDKYVDNNNNNATEMKINVNVQYILFPFFKR